MLDGTTSSVWEWSVIVKSYQKDYKAAVKLVLIDNYWWNVHLIATTVNAATKGSRYAKNILHDFIYWHFLTLKISKYIYTFFYFQNIENAPTEVFKTIYKGVGLRATADFPVETFIMEYVGEVLSESQFHKCAKKYSKNDAQHFYFMALSSEHFIDASCKGNTSRFINHSCNPNSETQKVSSSYSRAPWLVRKSGNLVV